MNYKKRQLLFEEGTNSKIKIAFILTIIGFLSISITYSLYTPAFEGADESWNYQYSKLVSENDIRPGYVLRHNPLYYYILGALLNIIEHPDEIEIGRAINKVGNPDPNIFPHFAEEQFPYEGTSLAVHLLRSFSIICGLVTIIFTYKIAKLIFSKNNWLPIYTMGFVAFIPKFIFVNSVLNNDVLVWTFSTVAVFFLIKLVNDTSKTRFLILLSIFTGLAYISKSNAIVLIPIVLVVFIYLFISKREKIISLIKKYLVFLGITFVSGLWYVLYKTLSVFDPSNVHARSIFALLSVATSADKGDTPFNIGISRIFHFDAVHYRLFELAWSGLGWHAIKLPQINLNIIEAILIISGIGLVVFFFRKKTRNSIPIDKNHLVILWSSVGFMFLAVIINRFLTGFGVARNTFPMIALFGGLVILGWFVFVEKRNFHFLIFIPIIFLIFANIFLITQIDTYYAHGLKSSYIDPFKTLNDIYNVREDLQANYPEVQQGDFKRIIDWANEIGYKEYFVLNINRPIIHLTFLYYNDENLQTLLPQVKEEKNVEPLVNLFLSDGLDANSYLIKNREYFEKYLQPGAVIEIPLKYHYDASSIYLEWTNARKAFDSNIETVWHSADVRTEGLPQWISIRYSIPIIHNYVNITAGNMWHPSEFEILGSNDGKTMTVLHSVTEEKQWESQSNHEYYFTNETPYGYYIINIKSVHDYHVEFSEIQFSHKDLN